MFVNPHVDPPRIRDICPCLGVLAEGTRNHLTSRLLHDRYRNAAQGNSTGVSEQHITGEVAAEIYFDVLADI